MSNRHHKSTHVLDEEQMRDAMKVLRKYCATKYRNSIIRSQNDLDAILTPRSPAAILRKSTYSFSRLPTFDKDKHMYTPSQDIKGEFTVDFRDPSFFNLDNAEEEERKWDGWNVCKSIIYYLGNKHIFFILFFIIFILFGGLLFMLIERPVHQELGDLQKNRESNRMRNFTENILVEPFMENCFLQGNVSKNESRKEIADCIESFMVHLKLYEKMIEEDRVNMNNWEWSYANSVFYTVTLIATIGYGNITCKSFLGKVVTLCYGLIGIPLTLTTMNIVGKALLRLLLGIWKSIKSKWKKKIHHSHDITESNQDGDESEYDDENIFEIFPLWLSLLIAFLFIICYSATFSYLEKWDFFTSVYFTVISFTTVGFGDVVPSNLGNALILLCFYFPGFCMGSLFIAIIQMVIENHYMLALQLIDQQQEMMEPANEFVNNVNTHPEVDVKERKFDLWDNINWRGHDESRESTPYPNGKRRSTVLISPDGHETVFNTPPVLSVFLNGMMNVQRNSSITRSESILSRNYFRSSSANPQSPSSCEMLPSNRNSRNFNFPPVETPNTKTALSPSGALSVINEYTDEDTYLTIKNSLNVRQDTSGSEAVDNERSEKSEEEIKLIN
ncbi:unnamed protein product [Auanema sp. JU1783]|nr:unnamed protein product [Auanema sp. JU1783]